MSFVRQDPVFHSPSEPSKARTGLGASLPVQSAKQILQFHHVLISRIKLQVGITDDEFERLYMSVLRTVAGYIQSIPATRDDHHTENGGLFACLLESSLLASQMADNKIFAGKDPVEVRANLEVRWRYAAFLAGMLSEIGLVTAVSVYNEDGVRWEPLIEPLLEFANRDRADTVYYHWLVGQQPASAEHRVYSGLILPKILERQHFQYLAPEGGSQIMHALMFAVSNQTVSGHNNSLASLVQEARDAIIEKYRQRKMKAPAHGANLPIQYYLVDALRRLCAKQHAVNTQGGFAWKTGTGVYVDWDAVAPEAVSLLRSDGLIMPRDPDTLAELLAETGVLQRSPVNGKTDSLYWHCQVDPEGRARRCVRLGPEILHLAEVPDMDLVVQPDPSPVTMVDKKSPAKKSSTRTSPHQDTAAAKPAGNRAPPETEIDGVDSADDESDEGTDLESEEGIESADDSVQIPKGDGQDRPPPARDMIEEGEAGQILMSIAQKVKTKVLSRQYHVLDHEDGIALRFPDVFTTIGILPSQGLLAIKDKGWIVQPSEKKKGMTHTIRDKSGAEMRAIILTPEISNEFISMLPDVETPADKNQASAPVGRKGQKVSGYTIAKAIVAAYESGELDKTKIHNIQSGTPNARVRLPFPDVIDVVARRLQCSSKEVTETLVSSPVVYSPGGQLVRLDTASQQQFILLRSKEIAPIADQQPQNPPKATPPKEAP